MQQGSVHYNGAAYLHKIDEQIPVQQTYSAGWALQRKYYYTKDKDIIRVCILTYHSIWFKAKPPD